MLDINSTPTETKILPRSFTALTHIAIIDDIPDVITSEALTIYPAIDPITELIESATLVIVDITGTMLVSIDEIETTILSIAAFAVSLIKVKLIEDDDIEETRDDIAILAVELIEESPVVTDVILLIIDFKAASEALAPSVIFCIPVPASAREVDFAAMSPTPFATAPKLATISARFRLVIV